MNTITEHVQKSSLGDELELVELDLTQFGEGILRWVSGDEGTPSRAVDFGGETYTPFPFKATGFDLTNSGSLPRPSLTVANVGGIFTPLVVAHQNLIGAPFRRFTTYDCFLDDGETPDSAAILPLDVYILNRKVGHNRERVQWELASPLDFAGVKIGRVCQRDSCDLAYRVWDPETETFDYSSASCPWEDESVFYDEFGNVTTDPAQDVCAKRLNGGCRTRFGLDWATELPFGGFPGVGKGRVT